jgi:hypothetical protein
MSAEFDHAVEALAAIVTEVDDKHLFSIEERRALDLMLEALKAKNLRLLSIGETGRSRSR